jgi:heterotetrameric sarcosine oxidase gamma subunit
MIPPGSAIVTEVAILPASALIAIDLWGAAADMAARLGRHLPPPCHVLAWGERRILWWEPNVWLVRAARSDLEPTLARLTAAVGGDGAATDLSGAFTRIRITGHGWRDLLMIGGVFDAEAASFGAGCVAGTVIHHLPVRLDVVSETVVDAYTPPSYAQALLGHWRRSLVRAAQPAT